MGFVWMRVFSTGGKISGVRRSFYSKTLEYSKRHKRIESLCHGVQLAHAEIQLSYTTSSVTKYPFVKTKHTLILAIHSVLRLLPQKSKETRKKVVRNQPYSYILKSH
jgi:hypothetical protein